MTEHYGFGDDLILPFIFVPHGEGETPELQEFKANYPGWFTIPATFTPAWPTGGVGECRSDTGRCGALA